MKSPASWPSRCDGSRLAYDLVIIADDSGSMQTRSTQTLTDPFAKSLTRWDELKSTLSIITEIGALMDENGVDVYFLNRDPIRGIKGPHSPELDAAFMDPPMGYTPTTRVLRQVLRDKGVSTAGASHSVDRAKKLLILIATDGQPTNDSGALMKDELYQSLLTERGPNPSNGSVVVTFLICSDDENEMRFLNGWDKRIPCVDVVDDYQAERRQILQVQGLEFPFSKGDWVCKMLLGGLDSEIDLLDERRVGGGGCGDVVSAGGSSSSGLNPGAAVSGLARRLSNSDCCIQ
ncbi:hypothetical protein BDR26DRAFT_518475 [Obelidium mucronatum]|nr:hypothetical protein BDR26DRAFT_518475 [Obelidium mucronatum]